MSVFHSSVIGSNDPKEIFSALKHWNEAYRSGNSVVSDMVYDELRDRLAKLEPNHPYLMSVEPEPVAQTTYKHLTAMLSTAKAYLPEEIDKWCAKVAKAASENGINDPYIRATPKLDGVACRYLTEPMLVTRGDGITGNVVTELLSKGLVIKGNTSVPGVGEIVMPQRYFDETMADNFAHPRNVVAGIVNADNHNPQSTKALEDGAVHLVIYNDMPHISVPLSDFKQNYRRYEEQVRMSEYPIDGVVYEVIDSRLKVFMGSNSHHHHWQLAHKRKGESRVVVVEDIQYQVGKSGKITPVVIIPPTKLSGAVVTRLTGHHVGNILRLGIGVGAEIEAIRSGEIIPTITGCVKRADTIQVPDSCPCCQSEVEMRGDFLYCTSKNCSAQAVTTIIHHFKTIGALLFGTKTVEKLVEAGYVTIPDVYALTTSQLVDVGLGEGQAKNLYNEMRRVLSEPLDDFRLLASLGISDLGRGSSKKLLAHWRIHELNRINMSDIEGIYGFGEIVAAKIANALRDNQTFEFLLQSFSKLVHTQDEIARQENVRASSTSSMAGKKVVFSGTCTKSRSDMNAYAESVGCITQKSVTIDTDYLVCGENVGQSKLSNAEKKGVKVISEAEFRDKV